jgi:myo-inositol-1(or 4)-monophosphatase
MNLLEEAICFAVRAHAGTLRKDGETPYILHPMEAAAICGTLTADEAVLAAAVLHDTVEDTDVTPSEIRARFGERVAALVASETEDKRSGVPKNESWLIRKEESLETLKNADDPGVKYIWLADKLSNLRGIYRAKLEKGDEVWLLFNQHDPAKHAWYYRTIAKMLSELRGYGAWKEYAALIEKVFEGVPEG